MKLLVVSQYFYPEQFRVNDICYELASQGHDVTVLTGLPNYPNGIVDKRYKNFKNRKEVVNGVTVIRSWLIGRGNTKLSLALNYISFAISAVCKALFIKKNFDVILVYQLSPVTMAIPAILLKKITKKPLVIYSHDLWPESIASAGISADSRIYKILFKLSKWIYSNADELFTSSKLFEKYFDEDLKINKKITHLPVYAESLFESIDQVTSDTRKINLLFAGNIGEMQSVETIIYAANELKENSQIIFHIVGDGSSKFKCEKLASELGLENIIFHGQHPITEMPKFYSLADAFVITLKANKIISYTLPNKVQSYMAAGKPIIGAIDGETQIVIHESSCGKCCNAEDYHGLAENIKQFANETLDQRHTYGLNAKKYYYSNYSKSIYLQKLNKLLSRIYSSEDVIDVQR
ncbi:glycosyltransferase family 4 protein [Paenibacillus sp. GCM10012307]|uniref:Glycosyltransferase family 4 protein n=1 Tax=Paenibacillus roseus TaxID=2798579 RepID=A0A934MPD9_9BACL|nr:glycosyltransferase family 4 protein [Paenibacillus roseus]MBJ6361976.1 glycosyltransferase family 4 protein [Paenibacillus roseus]